MRLHAKEGPFYQSSHCYSADSRLQLRLVLVVAGVVVRGVIYSFSSLSRWLDSPSGSVHELKDPQSATTCDGIELRVSHFQLCHSIRR